MLLQLFVSFVCRVLYAGLAIAWAFTHNYYVKLATVIVSGILYFDAYYEKYKQKRAQQDTVRATELPKPQPNIYERFHNIVAYVKLS